MENEGITTLLQKEMSQLQLELSQLDTKLETRCKEMHTNLKEEIRFTQVDLKGEIHYELKGILE